MRLLFRCGIYLTYLPYLTLQLKPGNVLKYTRDGWCNNPAKCLQPYYQRRLEISNENDILLWGDCVIVPESLRNILLYDLHMGIVKTKQLARKYIWWPHLVAEIEETTKACANCQENMRNPNLSNTAAWAYPSCLWKRLNMDFTGPEPNGQMYLIIIDAYSKYLEIFPIIRTDTSRTIEKLKQLFSIFSLPQHIVTDNGPQFISEEFKQFLWNNDIKHTKTAPKHPASNALAERYVGHWKNSLKKMGKTGESRQSRLNRCLLTYRATPTQMGRSPSELLMNRQPRVRYNALRFSNTKEQVKIFQDNMDEMPKFKKDNAVFAYNFGKGLRWMPGNITEVLSPKNFLVEVRDVVWKRHADQLRLRNIPNENYKDSEVEPPVYHEALATHDGILQHDKDVNITPVKMPTCEQDSNEEIQIKVEKEGDSIKNLNPSREIPVVPEINIGAGKLGIKRNLKG